MNPSAGIHQCIDEMRYIDTTECICGRNFHCQPCTSRSQSQCWHSQATMAHTDMLHCTHVPTCTNIHTSYTAAARWMKSSDETIITWYQSNALFNTYKRGVLPASSYTYIFYVWLCACVNGNVDLNTRSRGSDPGVSVCKMHGGKFIKLFIIVICASIIVPRRQYIKQYSLCMDVLLPFTGKTKLNGRTFRIFNTCCDVICICDVSPCACLYCVRRIPFRDTVTFYKVYTFDIWDP